MLRIIIAFILLMHGLIHLMGFAKAYGYAALSQLTQPIAKPAGLLWLLTTLLLSVAALLMWQQHPYWWVLAFPGILFSQILIISHWTDARFGTVANIIGLLFALTAAGTWQFDQMVAQEKTTLLEHINKDTQYLLPERVASLPPIVQQWLQASAAVGQPIPNSVYLEQEGEMRPKPNGKWIPFRASQYFNTREPAFLWQTNIPLGPGLSLKGRDLYTNGHGHMLIKMNALLPVADTKTPETDQGSMIRFLGELCWFPAAAVSDYLQWEQTDSLSARATIRYAGLTGTGNFHFSPTGELLRFDATRYYDRKGGATLEAWEVRNTAWKNIQGVRVPVESEVCWKLPEGDYTWLKLKITTLRYNDVVH